MARTYAKHLIPATPTDESFACQEQGRTLSIQLWRHLVCGAQKVAQDAPTFSVAVLHDPRFKHPWLLIARVALTQAEWATVYRLRWNVERPPLIAKPLLGAQRQFVHSVDVGARLFSLSLLAASMLAYFAAILFPFPTSFWERRPKPTAGRLRRLLCLLPFPSSFPLPERLRIKASLFDHLPKGFLARLLSSPLSPPVSPPALTEN
jgi:hypothetical protein